MINRRAVLLIFLGCALCDFLWGYIGQHAILAGVIGAILGLFGTTWYLLFYWISGKGNKQNTPTGTQVCENKRDR
jgi:hypothetical protein